MKVAIDKIAHVFGLERKDIEYICLLNKKEVKEELTLPEFVELYRLIPSNTEAVNQVCSLYLAKEKEQQDLLPVCYLLEKAIGLIKPMVSKEGADDMLEEVLEETSETEVASTPSMPPVKRRGYESNRTPATEFSSLFSKACPKDMTKEEWARKVGVPKGSLFRLEKGWDTSAKTISLPTPNVVAKINESALANGISKSMLIEAWERDVKKFHHAKYENSLEENLAMMKKSLKPAKVKANPPKVKEETVEVSDSLVWMHKVSQRVNTACKGSGHSSASIFSSIYIYMRGVYGFVSDQTKKEFRYRHNLNRKINTLESISDDMEWRNIFEVCLKDIELNGYEKSKVNQYLINHR